MYVCHRLDDLEINGRGCNFAKSVCHRLDDLEI